jgi:predicted nucleic acid-binding protein
MAVPDAYLIDTDVLSYILKHDSRAEWYLQHLTDTVVVISFMSYAELERWALMRRWGPARRQGVRRFLDAFITPSVDRRLCEAWAEIMVEARVAGRSIAHADAWVAATARVYDVPLVTNNARHFAGVAGLSVITERHS